MPSTDLSAPSTATDTRPLYAELIRRGLPAGYAERTAEELDDHRADLLADLRASHAADPEGVADRRLGETRQLARKIASDYRRRSWFGRWPLLSFVLLPPVVLVASVVAYGLVMLAIGKSLSWFGGEEGRLWSDVETARLGCYVLAAQISLLVPCVLAWFYGRFALSRTQSRAYVVTACLMIGLLNGAVFHDYRVNPEDPTVAKNLVGVTIGDAGTMAELFFRPMQAVQLAAPLLVGAMVLYRDQRRRYAALRSNAPHESDGRLAA